MFQFGRFDPGLGDFHGVQARMGQHNSNLDSNRGHQDRRVSEAETSFDFEADANIVHNDVHNDVHNTVTSPRKLNIMSKFFTLVIVDTF